MKYYEQVIAEYLEGASASLEVALQEIHDGVGTYYEKMVSDLVSAQRTIDKYLEGMRQVATQ